MLLERYNCSDYYLLISSNTDINYSMLAAISLRKILKNCISYLLPLEV